MTKPQAEACMRFLLDDLLSLADEEEPQDDSPEEEAFASTTYLMGLGTHEQWPIECTTPEEDTGMKLCAELLEIITKVSGSPKEVQETFIEFNKYLSQRTKEELNGMFLIHIH